MTIVPRCMNPVQLGDNISNPSFEAISVKIFIENSVLVIINVYRPPNPDKNFITRFNSYFKTLKLKRERFLLLGDFNFPHIDFMIKNIGSKL